MDGNRNHDVKVLPYKYFEKIDVMSLQFKKNLFNSETRIQVLFSEGALIVGRCPVTYCLVFSKYSDVWLLLCLEWVHLDHSPNLYHSKGLGSTAADIPLLSRSWRECMGGEMLVFVSAPSNPPPSVIMQNHFLENPTSPHHHINSLFATPPPTSFRIES